jgi:transcriptional regulator GlxA family with amidase domain
VGSDGSLRQTEEVLEMATDSQGEKTIAVVLYQGLTILDAVGPLQVLTMLERFAPRFRTVTVAERSEPVDTDVHVQMIPDLTFDEVPHPTVLVVPGGRMPTIRAMSDPAIRGYVRTAGASAEIVASVCTGSLILASVGLLEGRQATTNWFFSNTLERFGATYLQQRWVEDGKFIMSAGVSAGIDMGLYLAARLTDEDTARRVQLAMDYAPQPPFGPIDWARVPLLPRLVKGGFSLAAPVFAAGPRRLIRSEKRAPAPVSSAESWRVAGPRQWPVCEEETNP